MTNKQIAKVFKQAGFGTEIRSNCVVVSLNRPISTMEVQAVVDIPRDVVKKINSNEVAIFGEDS